MQRLALRALGRGPHIPPLHQRTIAATTSFQARQNYYYSSSSSPKEAEQASAQSGGSRSKDAEEQAAQSKGETDEAGALGRTGGGEPLSSSENAPPQPKINNAAVPGTGRDKLTPEQQEEVDRHNADFDKKHDRASPAADDKVDKGFWSGQSD